MTVLKAVRVFGTVLVLALAGCSSSGGETHHDSTRDNISMSGGHYAAPGYSSPANYQNTSNTMATADYDPSGNYRRDSSVGQILTTPDGRTVYVFDHDRPGVSSCYNSCATIWRPVIAPGTAQPFGEMTIIMRNDGARQWAYNGRPLYVYANDRAPGDVAGNGQAETWHVVQ
jgi:predicted lipoprotein with Yx(FWY)xxD motif